MLQKGISVSNLDVKYISSLSLYFLTYLGISKIIEIFIKPEMKFQTPMMNQPPPQNPFQAAKGNALTESFKN